ncbi:amidohydrolase family protein [Oribacterium sinus]|uniref:amidohydrolase family protein n=1 Tax=Oribacterium sinus TaxID=237576 RepID=UPI0028EFE864|nr:amidohydrolase family protein [Oribacterium sinus]
MIFKFPINDAHIHLFDVKAIEECIAMVDYCGYSHWNFLAYTMLEHKGCFANNLLAALMKLKEKGRCRAFASFDYAMDFTVPKAEELKRQIQFFDLAGFDGIKMLDGKPFVRMRQGIPLDAPNYDLMFDYAEKSQMPITYHINDPIEFWYWEKLPEWAKKEDNFYGNGKYLHKWELDEEAFGFLRKHPKLNIVLPHFFFVSDQPGLCSELFHRYANLRFDITPGWEMYENFAKDWEFWRDFFEKHSDKILFGTDTFSDHWKETVFCLRRVLETEEEFIAFEENCRGLNLKDEILQDLYFNNYHKVVRNIEKTIDVKMVLEYADTLYERIPKDEKEKDNLAILEYLKKEIAKYA